MATPTVLEAEFLLKWRLGVRSAMLIHAAALRFKSCAVQFKMKHFRTELC